MQIQVLFHSRAFKLESDQHPLSFQEITPKIRNKLQVFNGDAMDIAHISNRRLAG